MDALINTNPEGQANVTPTKSKSTTSRYSTDPQFREKMKAYMRARYKAKPKQAKQTRNDKYATDEVYREKIKRKAREQYYARKKAVELDINTLKGTIEKLLKIIIILV